MKNSIKTIIVFFLVATVIFTACEKSDNNPINPTIANFLSIFPVDNAVSIGINDKITVQFAAEVDTKIIENSLVLISQKDIADSTCPINKNMGHSDMNADMMDSSMMNHLQMQHFTKGKFTWNSDKTQCDFKPDKSLEPDTEYMIYLNPTMVNEMKTVMMNNGMMNHGMGMMNCDCGNKGLDKAFIITRFKTGNN